MQSGLDAMRRTLREKDPQLPSTMITSLQRTELTLTAGQRCTEPPKLISQIKGDLDWIVMKALEKDRNRRYDTANGLALDIQCYIESEPVLARPPSQLYRLQKLVQRNKIVFAAGAAVALALLFGLGLSTWMFFRERDAREQEAQLRTEAEDRAKITQAAMFVSQGKFDDADAMLNQVKKFPLNPTLDCASALRSVGEWQALQGRWPAACERYSALVKMDKLDNLNQIIFDYQAFSVVLAESGAREQYGKFFQMAVTNFYANPNGSILIASLLLPLNKSQIEMLKPMAAAAEKQLHALSRDRRSEWTFMPFCLWQYRCGNYEAAIQWCQNAQAQSSKFPCSDAIIHAVMAMAYYQNGQTNEACIELAQGRQLIDEKFKTSLDHGRPGSGFWYDWVYARHISQEAAALINCDSDKPATE
jgi:tetratricopeptide (TPR) repeat protein